MRRATVLSVLGVALAGGLAVGVWSYHRDSGHKGRCGSDNISHANARLESIANTDAPNRAPGPANSNVRIEELWAAFLAACKAGSYSEARMFLDGATKAGLHLRLEFLPVCADDRLTVQSAREMLSMALELFANVTGQESEIIRNAIEDIVRATWPSAEAAAGIRRDRYKEQIEGRSLSVPERQGLVPGDLILVALYTDTLQSDFETDSTMSGLKRLLDIASEASLGERAFFEPFISGVLGLLWDRSMKDPLAAIVGKFVDARRLSQRLRWELRRLSSFGAVIWDLLALVEEERSPDAVVKLLQGRLGDGLSDADVLDVLIPYLLSRFGSHRTSSCLSMAFLLDAKGLPASSRYNFIKGTEEKFLQAEIGSGAAETYLNFMMMLRHARDLDEYSLQIFSEVPQGSAASASRPPVVPGVHMAIARHWRAVAARLGPDDLSVNMPGRVCDALVDSAGSLQEAIAAIEEAVDAVRYDQQLRVLRMDFPTALMRFRLRFGDELKDDSVGRSRLVTVSERLLRLEMTDQMRRDLNQAPDFAASGVLLADQILALCVMGKVVSLSLDGGRSVRRCLEEFKSFCVDTSRVPPKIIRTWKYYEPCYQRVTDRSADDLLVPK